ncbi:MAG: tyrosine-type recombinase/integrase [Chloroflexi bacterium]|nr:tyrosine-type recombinase/integrase [Chloroflexota bacterium]
MRLQEGVERFLARYSNPNTLKGYRDILLAYVQDFGAKTPLETFTSERLDEWYTDQVGRGLAEATLASRIKTMKAFWNWCVKMGYIESNPAGFLVPKKRKISLITKAMPGKVLSAIMEAATQKHQKFSAIRDTAILAIMSTYGARAGDVAHLRLSNLNLAEQWLVLHVKGDKDVPLPLPPETEELLQHWLILRYDLDPDPPHDFVFTTNRTTPGKRYGPMAPESVGTVIKRLSVQVSGKTYGPHSIRHWRGQDLADKRVPPTTVQAILGHSDVKTTLDHYYNQDTERLRAALEENELLKGKETKKSGKKKKPDTTDPDFWRGNAG